MSERSGYKPGEFCWVDLAAPDVGAAARFYNGLLGTEFEPAGSPDETGGYGFLKLRGKLVAGIGPLQSPEQPSAWSSYIVTDDAEETVVKAKNAGGTVLIGPMDLPNESGRIVVMRDLEGAYINAIEIGRHLGAEIANEVGAWRWNELESRDLDKANAFYGAVFGWRFEHFSLFPPEIPYWGWLVEGQRWPEGIAGLNLLGPEVPAEVPPRWSVFLAVPDAREAADKAAAAGATILLPPLVMPIGIVSMMLDPQGAEVGIVQPTLDQER